MKLPDWLVKRKTDAGVADGQLYEARIKVLQHLALAEDKKAEADQHTILAKMYQQRIVRLTKEKT